MTANVTMHEAKKYCIRRKALPECIKTKFMQTFGCVRKVYNLYTDLYHAALAKAGYTGGDDIPEVPLPEVTEFKKQFPYLKEVDSLALANAKIDFTNAVKRFREQDDHKSYTKRALRRDKSGTEILSFRGLKGMPKFKSKAHGDFSYKTNCQYPNGNGSLKKPTIRLEGNMLYLPKIKEGIELIIDRPLRDGAVIGNVTISMDTDGELYASIEYSYTIEMDITLREAAANNDTSVLENLRFLGLDYSQQDFYVDSEGRRANYPHFYRQSEEKLAKLQKQLSRMQYGSENYKKKQKQIMKLHKKIRNQRKDFIEKLSTKLVEEYDVIVVEDINLRAMGQALHLAKNLHDNGFGMFRDALARKLERKGSILVKTDRWYPSSKTCHICGYKNEDLQLSDREWTCPQCGTHHGRDENAAVNIREEGMRIFPEFYAAWLTEDALSKQRAANLKAGRQNKKPSKKPKQKAA